MSLFTEPKIDCHVHVFDPVRFPYAADTVYAPAGAEIGTADDLAQVYRAYGVTHALLVEPNSGYGEDNRCMLDAIARSGGRYKGIAVMPNSTQRDALEDLRRQGVVGVAFNASLNGVAHYRGCAPLVRLLEELDMFLQIQVHGDQLLGLLPLLQNSGVRVLVDHCGRPVPGAGLAQPGFQALLDLGRRGRAVVKLSGQAKFSAEAYPHADARVYARALLEAFTPDACIWGTDWPFLRATSRIDVGTVLALAGELLPDAVDRRKVMHDNAARLFEFAT
ncbi:amidohydrolase family protein [Hydrogenophaga sp. 2FB]|uniref:amidohydrolase family protein n=1 Tax=Hydrogenophaga sp. 2FB TaxID=2502187 RepID=UPI0010F513E7|nr:amidohydrolase family protein [Hydrogenophaga sp. 2FB]